MPAAGDASGTGTAALAGPDDRARTRDDERPPRSGRDVPRLKHVPALDGLRGAAVAAVLLFHGGYLTGGWLGVDLFFVLSGYLITSLLLVERASTGGIALVAFWGRRARRLLPAVLLVLLAVAAYSALELGAADQATARGDGLATLFFVANWHDILGGASYWDRGLAPSLLAHTWSLAVEEQMYLVWPVLLAVVLKRRTEGRARTVVVLAAGLAVCSAALAIGLHLAGASTARIYLGTDTRAVAVMLGAVVAGWRRLPGGVGGETARRLEGIGIVAGGLLLVAWWQLDGTWELTYRGGLLLSSVLAAVVVAAAADRRSTRMGAVLAWRPLCWLGLVSYGAYLWHWPVYVVLSPARTELDGVVLLAVRVAATLFLAFLSYELVERPIRRRQPPGWFEGWRGFATAVVAVAVVAGALLVGTRDAASIPRERLEDGVDRGADPLADAPEVLVLGDSVAASLALPAIDDPEAFGVNVTRSTVQGCQLVWDGEHRARGVEQEVTEPEPCPEGVRELVAERQPDAVVVQYGGWVAADLEIDGSWRGACDPAYRTLLEARTEQLLADAGSTGAPVVVVGAARSTNEFRPEDTWERTACANETMAAVVDRTDGASFVDLDTWVCPDGECRDEVDGLLLRSDGVHFGGPGGVAATRWMLDQVAAAAGYQPADQGAASAEAPARAQVCRGYAELRSITSTLRSEGLSADLRVILDRSLARFDEATLAQLDPAWRADLAPLAGPELQGDLDDLVDRIYSGEIVTDPELPDATKAQLDAALTRLAQIC